jgi:cyclopropane fatty-acyl-phospholipid synthase-like methyltransferase
MRVLDLGCGKAVSAIFLAKEFDVQVWAIDPSISASENYIRIKEMNCEDKVFPLKTSARDLAFPEEFFDVIIAVDSYMGFGTDERFTPYIAQYLKPGGHLGIVDICFSKEINFLAELPEFMRKDYHEKWYYVHSLDWWVKLWTKTGLLNIKTSEIIPQNDIIRNEYVKYFENHKKKDVIADAIGRDDDKLINIFRLVAERSEKEIFLDNYFAC